MITPQTFIPVFCCLLLTAIPLAADAQAPAIENTTAKNVNVTEAEQLIAKGEVKILDVRTPEEFAAGHIAGATNLDINAPDFQEKLNQLEKGKKYLVHCAAGGRSARASAKMKGLGFGTVFNLEGGLKAWESAGKKIEK